MRDYTRIQAWKLADDSTVVIYEQTRSFPKEELYGLTSQLRRAAYSVAANIAEGSSRESKKESGRLTRIVATTTSLFALTLARFVVWGYVVRGPWSVARGPQENQVFAPITPG